MSFPRYSEYKDSGVEWLGDVPGHWDVKPIKAVSTCNDAVLEDLTSPEYIIEYIEISGVDAIRGISETSVIPFGNAPSRARRRVADGDVLVSTVRTYLRAIAPVINPPTNMIASTGFAVIRPRHIEPSFLGFMFQAEFLIAEIIARSVGVSYPAINASDLMRLDIPIPTREEQQTIAAFLDCETRKIDALIAEQQRLVELLAEKRQAVISHAVTKGLGACHSGAGRNPAEKIIPQSGQNRCPATQEFSNQLDSGLRRNDGVVMKDSGIAWLGEVPVHWEVFRLGTVFQEFADEGQADRPILSVSIHDGVSDRELDDKEMDRKVTRSEDRGKYKSVEPGDLVYNMMRAWQGGFGTVQVQGMVSPAYVVARPRYPFSTAFIEQQLRSPQAIEEMRRHSRGVTDFRLRLYWDEFKSISVVMAPSDEQNAIAAFLDTETAKIDALTLEANRAIALLQERRSALISAAVTGKIDVRKFANQEAI